MVENEKLVLVNEKEIAVNPLVPTVFHEHWWLSAATRGRYEEVQVSSGNKVLGRFPFAVCVKPARRISMLPTLTHILGPAIDEGSGNAKTRFLQRYTITKELIAKLPNLQRFRQKLHRGYPEALGFQSAGFRTGVQFTFEIQAQAEGAAWNGLRNKTRNVIRRADEILMVCELQDAEEFVRFYTANLLLRRQMMTQPPEEYISVCQAALERKAGKILCARNAQREMVAAIFLAFDSRASYYLMSTRTLDSPNGATSLLIWNGIRFCIENGLVFDFDGIVSEGAVLFYAGFGGQPKPTYIVSRDSKRIKLIDSSRGVFGLIPEENFFDR